MVVSFVFDFQLYPWKWSNLGKYFSNGLKPPPTLDPNWHQCFGVVAVHFWNHKLKMDGRKKRLPHFLRLSFQSSHDCDKIEQNKNMLFKIYIWIFLMVVTWTMGKNHCHWNSLLHFLLFRRPLTSLVPKSPCPTSRCETGACRAVPASARSCRAVREGFLPHGPGVDFFRNLFELKWMTWSFYCA